MFALFFVQLIFALVLWRYYLYYFLTVMFALMLNCIPYIVKISSVSLVISFLV